MEQRKNTEQRQPHNDESSAAKGMSRQPERNSQNDMNPDQSETQKRVNRDDGAPNDDNRDSTHNPNPPHRQSRQRSRGNQDQQTLGSGTRADERRLESSKSGHEDRVFNTPNRPQKGSDRSSN
jgi:hypothetical protein